MRNTVFLDIDGCIFKHPGNYTKIFTDTNANQILPGVRLQFLEWEREGTYIVLVTGRKECLRKITEEQLLSHGLFWDVLLMGLNNGPRTVINDRKPNGDTTAYAINLNRNEGFLGMLDRNDAKPPHDK
jgi:hypothetical protein